MPSTTIPAELVSEQESKIRIVFGAMTFGKEGAEQARVHDLSTACSMLDIFQKIGHNEVDTSRQYGDGASEEMLHGLRWQERGLQVSTKMYPTGALQFGPEGWDKTLRHTSEGIQETVPKSLKALKTHQVDIWYLHGPDRTVTFEETMRAVNDIYQLGFFKRLGLSNYMAWEVARICGICKANNYKQPDVYQGIYNALHRAVEPELFPCLRHYGIAFYAYNPLAGGYLTDRYHRKTKHGNIEDGARFDASRWQGRMYRSKYWNDEYFSALDILRPVARANGLTEAEAALRWMMHHSQLDSKHGDAIVTGASSVKQLEQNLLDLEKGPLPKEVVLALNDGWAGCKAISFKYWH
ncbi:hypothetical protein DOTSEDRAFT_71172 [Dothistroma septosporum NZE10]|uniref:NADP-dependent oxidoreductase domain-containing protein n=1 Tax=Dothistroma septosporum (strain NZE10 / CBS 128990) TaxID=675120 RepID=N1PSK5_DOTSN|nr:hypothetical protein DOTSEDRAFT_71172 [Dothistroma septosporum NZE10]